MTRGVPKGVIYLNYPFSLHEESKDSVHVLRSATNSANPPNHQFKCTHFLFFMTLYGKSVGWCWGYDGGQRSSNKVNREH